MLTKLQQFTKPGPFSKFQLFKLSQLCYHFCRVKKNEYPQLSPALCRLEFIDKSFLPKKIMYLDIFNNNKKCTSFSGTLLYISVLHFFLFFLKISKNFNLFGKVDSSMNFGRQRAWDSEGYLKNIFSFSKLYNKW